MSSSELLIGYTAMVPVMFLVIFGLMGEQDSTFGQRFLWVSMSLIWPILIVGAAIHIAGMFLRWFFTGKTE
jgi:hypothetical protein